MLNASDRNDDHGQGYFYVDKEGVFVHTFSAEGPEAYERRIRSGNVFPEFGQIAALTKEARKALAIVEQTERNQEVRKSFIQKPEKDEKTGDALNEVDLAV